MKRIAVYGKGGIGKSTISCNISATMGMRGKRVLQIGCDPKHDSTLLLAKEEIEVTLLEQLTNQTEVSLEILIHKGKFTTKCVEIGGPKPGIGCAGRGIIRGLDTLNKLNCFKEDLYDLVLYDVLGDVVCGGFFEPLRSGKTEELYIVTSGEFNSLFAANNIIMGYNNNSTMFKNVRLGGIIGNCRKIRNEVNILEAFAKAVNVPLVAVIPRDDRFETCSENNHVIFEQYPDSNLMGIFNNICDFIESTNASSGVTPLTLPELRKVFTKTIVCNNMV